MALFVKRRIRNNLARTAPQFNPLFSSHSSSGGSERRRADDRPSDAGIAAGVARRLVVQVRRVAPARRHAYDLMVILCLISMKAWWRDMTITSSSKQARNEVII